MRSLQRLRLAAVVNHNYAFDILLGLLEAADARGLRVETSVLGYELAERFPLARQNCMALGDICRTNAHLNALVFALSTGSAGETEHHANLVPNTTLEDVPALDKLASPLSLSVARGALAKIWNAERLLKNADLLLCGYPYVLCYLIDDVPAAASTPMFVPLHGTIVSEYIDARLQPWVFSILQRWIFGNVTGSVSERKHEQPQELPRCVVAVNYIEQAWFRRTLGPISFVPLGARHLHRFVRHAIGPREADKGLLYSSSRIALHRIPWALPMGDARGFLELLLHGASLAGARFQPVFLSRSHQDWELLNFRAAVLIPWDWEITTFIELYRLPLPLFLPDDDFMTVLIWRTLRQGDLRRQQRFIRFRAEWWRGAPCHQAPVLCGSRNGTGVADAGEADSCREPPWLSADTGVPLHEQIRGWYAETDYRRFPHVGRFSGLADLLRRVSAFDPRDSVRAMHSANEAALKASAEAYEALLAAF